MPGHVLVDTSGWYWNLVGEARNAIKCPTVHWRCPGDKELSAQNVNSTKLKNTSLIYLNIFKQFSLIKKLPKHYATK